MADPKKSVGDIVKDYVDTAKGYVADTVKSLVTAAAPHSVRDIKARNDAAEAEATGEHSAEYLDRARRGQSTDADNSYN